MSHIDARSGTLAILALLVCVASVTSGACSRGKYTKVTRTDGSTVIGTLVSMRPDVVVLQTRGGRIEIRRSDVTSLDVPTISEIAELEGGQANNPATSGPGNASAGSGTPASGGAQATSGAQTQASSGTPSGGRANDGSGAAPGGGSPGSAGAEGSGGTGGSGSSAGSRGSGGSAGTYSSADGRTKAGSGGPGTQSGRGASGAGVPGRGTDGTSGAGRSGGTAADAGASPNDGVTNDDVTVATIPAGTSLTVTFDTPLGSDTSHVEDEVVATMKSTIAVGGARIVPAGALLRGRVTEATPAKAAGGRGRLAIRFHTLVIGARATPIDAPAAPVVAAVFTREDKKKVGIGAAAGAVLGGIVSRTKKGLGIGAAAGASGAAAAVGIRNEVRVARGAALRLQLTQSVSVPIQ